MESALIIIKQGGVVAYPTETYYALGADAFQEAALKRVVRIKGRAPEVPMALILGGKDQLGRVAQKIPPGAKALMAAFWPGPLTLLFQARDGVSPLLTAHTGKIGVRLSSHPLAQALASGAGVPLTATSANRSGSPPLVTARQVAKALGGEIDYILDGGRTPGGPASTVLDMTRNPPVIIRPGPVSREAIIKLLSKKPGSG